MKDIVERLRDYPDYEVVLVYRTVIMEAADEIERLRKQIKDISCERDSLAVQLEGMDA